MGDNITGRKYDHDVLENEEQVAEVIDNLNTIATKGVSDAQDGVNEAITALNNVKGLSEYVGTINTAEIGAIFTEITTSVQALGTAMQQSADSIKEYDESEWYEKAGSTILMGLAKVGEGLLNILEDIGDGFLTIGGTVAGIWGGEKWFEDKIKAEWSHDAFDKLYYQSDLAKKSWITEDSDIAGACKLLGTTAGYIAISTVGAGYFSGLGAATTFASSSTIANTTLAALTGLGSGEESGLRQGKGFYEALVQNALPQGALQGLVAFAGEKIGEQLSGRTAAVKAAKSDISAAKEAFNEADDVFAQATKAKSAAAEKLSKASGTAEKKAAQEAYENANKSWLDAAAKRSGAYDDILSAESKLKSVKLMDRPPASQKGYEAGKRVGIKTKEAASEVYKNSIAKGNSKLVAGTKATFSGAKTTLKESLSGINPLKNFGKHSTAVENTTAATTAANTVSKEIVPIANTPVSITTAVKAPTLTVTAAKAPSLAASAAKVPVAASAWLNSGGREISERIGIDASTNLSTYDISTAPTKPYTINDAADIDRRIGENFVGAQQPQPTNTSTPSTGNTGSTSSSPSGTSTGSTSGGYTSGGNTSSGGYSTGSPSYQSTVDSGNTSSQLKKAVEETVTDPVTEVAKTTPATTPETTTPVDTPVQTTPQETPAAVVTVPESNGGYYDTTYHTGGGYSGEGYYQDVMGETPVDTSVNSLNPLDETLQDNSASIDEIVKGSKYTKIPSSSKPITTTTSTGSGSSSVIPIAAGLSAAAAAGIGAKAYMDRKKNNDFNDDEDDDFETEEWSGDDESVNVDYDDSSDTQLDNDDDYSYQTEPEEKYGARSNEELADLQ